MTIANTKINANFRLLNLKNLKMNSVAQNAFNLINNFKYKISSLD